MKRRKIPASLSVDLTNEFHKVMKLSGERLRASAEQRRLTELSMRSEKASVNHPPHYTSHPSGVECIQITEHFNFNIGNAVKYLWRAGLKYSDPKEDLEKALWYVNRELKRLAEVKR